MGVLSRVLFWTAVTGTITSSIYTGLVVVGAVRFGRRKRGEDAAPATFLPSVSVLKPLHGAEPDLDLNLRTFFVQDYPSFEILFCARHATDAGLQLAQGVAAEFPAVSTQFLTCGEPKFPNAKMWSFQALAEAAQNDVFITSDADARVAPDYLLRCVQALADDRTELASCLYIGQTTGGFAAQLDAVGKSVEMSGGILVADLFEGTRFALGVTMILRRRAFLEAGGYEELGEFYAEDFVLGNRLAERGFGVRLSNHVIRLMVLPQGLRASFRDQLRWMRSTRRSRPAGHLGTGLTFAMPFGVLGLLLSVARGQVGSGLLWLGAAIINRWIMAWVVLWALGDRHGGKPVLIYPLRDLLGWMVWVSSYLGSATHQHGGRYAIDADGRYRGRGHAQDVDPAAVESIGT